jgi:hypothetical protein
LVEQIEEIYDHLLPDAAEFTRGQLDAFDALQGKKRRKSRVFCRLAAVANPARVSDPERKRPLCRGFFDRGAEI